MANRYRDMRAHLIHDDDRLQDLDRARKLNAEWSFPSHAAKRSRTWAQRRLAANNDKFRVRSPDGLDKRHPRGPSWHRSMLGGPEWNGINLVRDCADRG